MLLLYIKELLVAEALEMDISLDKYNSIFYSRKYVIDSRQHFESILNTHRNSLGKIIQKLHSNNINRKSLPSNVTMREEYIKCGKECCNKCRHGPYYYGYWREKGKLKKKYIGISK